MTTYLGPHEDVHDVLMAALPNRRARRKMAAALERLKSGRILAIRIGEAVCFSLNGERLALTVPGVSEGARWVN